MRTVDVETLAAALDVTPRRVQQLAKDEGLPRVRPGEYDLAACLAWWAAYRHRVEARRGMADDFESLRARKLLAEARLLTVQLGLETGDLVKIDDTGTRLRRPLEALRDWLRNTKGRYVTRLVGAHESEVDLLVHEAFAEASSILSTGPAAELAHDRPSDA